MVLIVFVGVGIVIFNMFATVHQDTTIRGTVQSVNETHVTLTDGQTFTSGTYDASKYCKQDQSIQIDPGVPNTIRCGGNLLNVNILQNLN